MEMINVLKRLAELDAGNPNVSQPTMKQEETLAESPETITEGANLLPKLPEPGLDDMRALSGVKRLNESTIAECGMPAMGAPMPSLPASINMSAQSATEIVAMMRGMMDLAHSDRATQASMPAMGAPMPSLPPPMGAPMPSLTPPMGGMDEPEIDMPPVAADDTGSDELADMMKKLSTGEPVKIKTDMPVKVSTDKEVKSTDDAMNQKEEGYANSPDEKTKGYNPNDFANIINKVKTADIETTPYGSGSNPMPESEEEEEDEEKMAESLESKLMAEYKAFMAEGTKTMSRAAKGHEKYGKEGMQALAKAGKKGKDLDPIRKKYDKYDESVESDNGKLPSMAHIKKMCQDGKSVAEICKMHPDCDQKELKQMVADCKGKMEESAKPDFLDLDKDGNKKEPMKKAAKDVKKK